MKIIRNLLSIDIENVLPFISVEELITAKKEAEEAYDTLLNRSGRGNDFLGWLDLPSSATDDELGRITKSANYLRKRSDFIVTVGIGGSYLGARAVVEALSHSFRPLLRKKSRFPYPLFAGQNLSEDYHSDMFDLLEDKDYSVIVISKSGTTTEPAVAFRLLKKHLEKLYGRQAAAERIIAVTDSNRGALRKLADEEGYKTFNIPDDVGGRYSVLTPVGLLPVAAAGFSVSDFVEGALEMENLLKSEKDFETNPAMLYAGTRNLLFRKGKDIEIFASFLPSLFYLIEWWKQLFGESEGKEGSGIFPAGTIFTTDLHSMGQIIQEGKRNMFETVLEVEKTQRKLKVPEDKSDIDGLNYIADKRLGFINEKAAEGTIMAHTEGGIPNISLKIPAVSEKTLGGLMYFFEFSCAVSGYILGVNPFDQPGVEAYKKNMFSLLGKS